MHKKHYKLMAEAFARQRQLMRTEWNFTEPKAVEEFMDAVEDEICLVLNHDNPSFDYEKFTDASGRKD